MVILAQRTAVTSGLTLDLFPVDAGAWQDTDGDGHPDGWNTGKSSADSTTGLTFDAFPVDAAEWLDSDGDGVGDNSDAYPTDPAASVDSDGDGDGYPDAWNQGMSAASSITGITMLDAFPNDPTRWDPDTDGDGVYDDVDAFINDPAASMDSDGDGYPDSWNSNATTAQISASLLVLDQFPFNSAAAVDTDGDGYPDVWLATATPTQIAASAVALDLFPSDPLEWADMDGDGIGDNSDPDIDGDGVSNVIEVQTGFDPKASTSKPSDRDGDGYPDSLDSFPDDPAEWADLDGDGIGDNSDPDIDGDGILNIQDAYPRDASRWSVVNDTAAPVAIITSPAAGALVSVSQIVLAGTISDDYSIPSLAIDGLPVAIILDQSGRAGSFAHQIDLTGKAEGAVNFSVTMSDSRGNSGQMTHSISTMSATL